MEKRPQAQGRLPRSERGRLAQAAALAVVVAGRPLTTSELLLMLERAGAAPPGLSRSGRLRQLASVLAREGAELGFAPLHGRFRTISAAALGRPPALQWQLDLAQLLALDEPMRALLAHLEQQRAERRPPAPAGTPASRSSRETAAAALRRAPRTARIADALGRFRRRKP